MKETRIRTASVQVRRDTATSISAEPAKLIPEIERITEDSLAKFTMAAAIEWDSYATDDQSLADDITALKELLESNDEAAKQGLKTWRKQAYGALDMMDMQSARYTEQAKQKAKKPMKARLVALVDGEKAVEMRLSRMIARGLIGRQIESRTVQDQIEAFRKRGENEIRSPLAAKAVSSLHRSGRIPPCTEKSVYHRFKRGQCPLASDR
jgi:hypothetical protein